MTDRYKDMTDSKAIDRKLRIDAIRVMRIVTRYMTRLGQALYQRVVIKDWSPGQ
jgi:hypothetical protein